MGAYSYYVLPWLIDMATSGQAHAAQRRWLAPQVAGDVLEVGFGAGGNLPFYEQRIKKLHVVDPNPGMLRRAARRVDESKIEIVPTKLLDGRDLDAKDDSYDCVVSSWTMCTIADLPYALAEIHRVLRPGGRLIFVEHGLAPDPRVARWQNWFNPLNRVIGGGCNLNRDIGAAIRAQPFQIDSSEEFYLENTLKIGGYTYRGVAVK